MLVLVVAIVVPGGASAQASTSLAAPAAFAAPALSSGPNLMALLAVQQAELTASDAADSDHFGVSVALSGDTALVGVPNRGIGGNDDVGAAYIFTRSGTIWSQQAELTASDGKSDTVFGESVALSGDTALIGAPCGWAPGAAYIFTRSGTSWSQQAELTASDGAGVDDFGGAVALSGDGSEALVGASCRAAGAQTYVGAAYVFTDPGTGWAQQAELTASDGAAQDFFGESVALSGDTAIVGAPAKTVGAKGRVGAAYIFTGSGASWSQQAALTAADGAANDDFGGSVAVSGGTALVGAQCNAVGAKTYVGAAYIFTGSGTSWAQKAELAASDRAAGDMFGCSVALSGGRALVGAVFKPAGVDFDAGAAYVFTGSGASWPQQAKLTASDETAGGEFGYAVSLSGDTALIGSPFRPVGTVSNAGAAYVDVLSSAPSVGLKSSTHSVKVGKRVKLSGVVAHAMSGSRSVLIERKVKGKLKVLKSVTCGSAGAFKWTWKASTTGKWVLVAVYKCATGKYASKPSR